MIVTTAWIEKNYNKFNKEFFGNMLPNIAFKTNRSRKNWGFATYTYDWAHDTIHPTSITISNYYDSPENVKIQTLLHEMIHIADYTFHPEHFIKNHRKVSIRQYDAHGEWFMNEANRISRESGYKITNYVTKEEVGVSCLSEKSQRCLENKKNNALICVVHGTTGMNFYFKTDVHKVDLVKKTISRYTFYKLGSVKNVKFYSFDNEKYANIRSCAVYLKGWFADNIELNLKLRELKATEVRF